MASHKTYTDNKRGVTLIEVIMVISIVATVASMAIIVNMESYRGNNFRNTRDSIVSGLQHARALSINNVCYTTAASPCTEGKPHGIHINIDVNGNISDYVIFQGTTYSPTDTLNTSIDIGKNVTKAVSFTGLAEVSFEQLSGKTTAGTITLTDGEKTSVISIGSEGQISWTN